MITNWSWATERKNKRRIIPIIDPLPVGRMRITKIPLMHKVEPASVSRYRVSDLDQRQVYKANGAGRPIAFFSTDASRIKKDEKEIAVALCQAKYGVKE